MSLEVFSDVIVFVRKWSNKEAIGNDVSSKKCHLKRHHVTSNCHLKCHLGSTIVRRFSRNRFCARSSYIEVCWRDRITRTHVKQLPGNLCNTLYQTNNLPYCCFQLFSSLRWGGGWRTIDLRHSLTTSTHFLKTFLTVVRAVMYWDESIQCIAWYSQYMGGLKWSEV